MNVSSFLSPQRKNEIINNNNNNNNLSEAEKNDINIESFLNEQITPITTIKEEKQKNSQRRGNRRKTRLTTIIDGELLPLHRDPDWSTLSLSEATNNAIFNMGFEKMKVIPPLLVILYLYSFIFYSKEVEIHNTPQIKLI